MLIKKDKISGDALGTGRRKTAVARVRLRDGSGKIVINKRPFEEYFPEDSQRKLVLGVLEAVDRLNAFDIQIRATGGGPIGQAGACRMGIARALISHDHEQYFKKLRDDGYLTRDSRMKERKKYGLRGARRGVQFSKR
jgi:small subunit ribosomal protein S9